MILHPIIDLLKRIVVALPDYAGGCGEDDSNGLIDLAFDYTNGAQSWSGVVEDNTAKNYSLSTYCSPPLLLKKPIVFSTGDIITVTIISTESYYASVGFMYPFVYMAGRNLGTYIVADNTLINVGTNTFTCTYSDSGLIVDRMVYYPRSSPVNNVQSAQISLSINDDIIF